MAAVAAMVSRRPCWKGTPSLPHLSLSHTQDATGTSIYSFELHLHVLSRNPTSTRTTLRFYHFRHSRARAASGPSPIDSACPKTPRTMLDLRDRSLRRSREAPRRGRPASAAVEAVASTAADAAFTLPSRPSTRNQSLAPLAVHHGHPPGSVGRSQSCKDMHLWSTRIVRKKVVYPKKSPEPRVNSALHSATKTQNRDLWRKPDAHMTPNNP